MNKEIFSRRNFVKLALTATACTAAAGAGALTLSSCGTAASNKAKELEEKYNAGDASSVQKVTDSCGRTVYLPKTISAVSPSGALAQILLATLCPDLLISLSGTFSKSQLRYLNSSFADLPALGRLYGQSGDLNYENLIKLNPDVIVDVGERKETIKEDMDSVQQKTGLPTIFVEGVTGSFDAAYETLGRILGCSDKANDLALYISDTYNFAFAHQEEVAAKNMRVLYAGGEKGYDVRIKGSTHAAVLDVVGVENVAVIEDSSATEVSPEKMLEWNPDYILLSPEDGFFEEIYEDKVWAGISGVQKRQVFEVPTGPYEWLDRPPSIQQTLGVKWLGNLLAPEIYKINMVEETKTFYSKFWGCTLSDEEARALLANSTLLP